MRREINQINVLIKCNIEKQFTAHQKRLLNKFLKNYGNTKMTTLKFKCIVKEGNSYAGQYGGKFLRTYFYP